MKLFSSYTDNFGGYDLNRKKLKVGDVVRIIGGKYKGRTATVEKYSYGNYVTLQIPSEKGMVGVNWDDLELELIPEKEQTTV